MHLQRTVACYLLLIAGASAQSFWTPERKAETVIYACAIAADSWTSNRNANTELDPLARPFVNHGVTRETIGASLGFAAGVLPSYLLHHSGHEKASRVWLRVFTAGESLNAARQLYLFH